MDNVVASAITLTISIVVTGFMLSKPLRELLLTVDTGLHKKRLYKFASEIDSSICTVMNGGSTFKKIYSPGVNITIRKENFACLVTMYHRSLNISYIYPLEIVLTRDMIQEGYYTLRTFRYNNTIVVEVEPENG